MKKKILMTGGSGFIASHFHERLTDTPVNNLDLVAPAHPLHSAHIQGDVRNPADVERAITGCSSIIHLAAAHHDFGISREEYFDVNENGARVICEAAAKHKVRDVVFYSSVAVFGEDYEMTVDDTEPRPTNDYGASKLAAERVLREWAREDTNVDCSSCVPSWYTAPATTRTCTTSSDRSPRGNTSTSAPAATSSPSPTWKTWSRRPSSSPHG